MSVQRKPYVAPSDYLVFERAAETKSEYFNGEIFAMAGVSEEHNTITVNLSHEVSSQLKGKPCRTYVSDMRVRIRDFGIDKYTYPDLVVVCGEREFEDDVLDTLVNPSIIIEVLSKSTEAYDRGAKFAHYRRVPSFQEYVLVSQTEPFCEHYVRHADGGWLMTEHSGVDDTIPLTSAGVELSLAEIYYKRRVRSYRWFVADVYFPFVPAAIALERIPKSDRVGSALSRLLRYPSSNRRASSRPNLRCRWIAEAHAALDAFGTSSKQPFP